MINANETRYMIRHAADLFDLNGQTTLAQLMRSAAIV